MKLRMTKPALPLIRRSQLPDRSDLVLAAGGACLVAACLFVFAGPGLHQVRQRSREQAVRANAATLQLAAETFAAMHRGQYATDPFDLLPLLPNDRAPRNPYTGDPVRFNDAPGDLTYRASAAERGYVIEAWGDAMEIAPLLRLTGHGTAGVTTAATTATAPAGDSWDEAAETAAMLRLTGRPAALGSAAGF